MTATWAVESSVTSYCCHTAWVAEGVGVGGGVSCHVDSTNKTHFFPFPILWDYLLIVVLVQRGSIAPLWQTGFPCSAQPCLNSSAAAFERQIIRPPFARMFRQQSGKHKASSHFCALGATLCVKAFNDWAPFFVPFQTVCAVLPAASSPASLSATCHRSGDPITISRTAKDYIASLHRATFCSFAIKDVKPFFLFWEFAFGPNAAPVPHKSLRPVSCRRHN